MEPGSNTDDITTVVARAVEADSDLSDETSLLVLAALEGDEALADLAGFDPPQLPAPSTREPAEPAGAFLRSIQVRGFRGIGPSSTLELTPAPGLTVIAGRNGSGKSSFCEALEVALTGDTERWKSKSSTAWRSAWRNLHQQNDSAISVRLAEETVGTTEVTVSWPSQGEFKDLQSAVQRHGQKKETGLDSLGWAEALDTYRPLLTYEELGGILTAEPSRLYDALSEILGLGALAEAIRCLDARHKELSVPVRQVAASKRAVLESLSRSDDERAARASKLLRAHKTDWAALQGLATGTDSAKNTVVDALRSLLEVPVPDHADALAKADRLQQAVAGQVAVGDLASAALDRQLRIVEAAVEAHRHDGDMTCPVCGVGSLDAATAMSLQQGLEAGRQAVRELSTARRELDTAVRAARDLIRAIPAALGAASTPALPVDVDTERQRAAAAWQRWADLPDDPVALEGHLRAALPELISDLTILHQVASTAVTALDDAWAPLAAQLAGHLTPAREAAEQAPTLQATKAALDWLKNHDQELKNRRLRPIAEQAMQIWSALRQESNVEIAGLTLEGTNTKRRVAISSAVDGQEAPGLTVLSQGELHALALALFLPRATVPDSPFRFVVLDDPVQAMDPSKVDGLLKVLAGMASTRQVVVFSHDDRLASAVRQGGVVATILEVSRDTGSVVTVSRSLDPGERYLSDAYAMARDGKLPEETKRRLLPGMLRLAVESVARDRWFTTALGRGDHPRSVEDSWNRTQKTSGRVGLGLYGSVVDLGPWLQKEQYRHRAMGVCTSGFHDGLSSKPIQAHDEVSKLISDLRAGVR